MLTAYGAFGEKKLYGKTVTGVIRSTFVVDEDGKVALAQYNVKATGHVAKLRRDLGLAAELADRGILVARTPPTGRFWLVGSHRAGSWSASTRRPGHCRHALVRRAGTAMHAKRTGGHSVYSRWTEASIAAGWASPAVPLLPGRWSLEPHEGLTCR